MAEVAARPSLAMLGAPVRVLLLSLATVLSACQMDASPPDGKADPAVASERPATRPPDVAASAPESGPVRANPAAGAVPTVPAEYQGVWDASQEACRRPFGPSYWEISDLQVSGLAGVAEVMTVHHDGTRLTLETLFFSERSTDDGPQPHQVTLDLTSGGLALSAFGGTTALVRCPYGA